MSESLDSNGIEDVVSSVRRLVSPEARPRSRDAGSDPLLLTPALRVAPVAEVIAPLILSRPLPDPEPAVTEPEPAAVAASGGAEAEAGAVQAAAAADTEDAAIEAELHAILTGGGVDVEPEPTAPVGVDGVPSQSGVGDVQVAGDEAELVVVDADWDGPVWVEPDVSLAEAALTAEVAELVEPLDEAVEPQPVPEAAIGEVAVPASPVGPRLGQADVVPFPLAPVAVPALDDAVATGAADEARAEPHGDAAAAAAELDEAALARLVRSLIREELQGALGERITQSVRKLVRAEINRALAARALD